MNKKLCIYIYVIFTYIEIGDLYIILKSIRNI